MEPPSFAPEINLDEAPEEINVYTDGSMTNPKIRFYGLLGYGAFWPRRSESTQDIDNDEMVLADGHRFDNDGMTIYGHLKGLRGSSTRAEIFAAIVALPAKGSVHIGSDSMNVVRGIHAIRSSIRSNDKRRLKGLKPKAFPFAKRFGLVNDGDLWQQMYARIISKGAHAVKTTWVKGHATDIHIAQGKATLASKIGNDAADKAADDGVATHNSVAIDASTAFAQRLNNHSKLIYRIQSLILRVRKTETLERDRRELAANPFSKKASTMVKIDGLPDDMRSRSQDDFKPIQTGRMPEGRASAKLKAISSDTSKDAWTFIRNLSIAHVNHEGTSTTWVELFTLSPIRGVIYKCKRSERNKAADNPSMGTSIQIFKDTLRYIANRCLHPRDKAFFSSANEQ